MVDYARILEELHSQADKRPELADTIEFHRELPEVQAEAGKAGLQVDSAWDATQAEVEVLRRENERSKQLVAELSLQAHLLKKTVVPRLD